MELARFASDPDSIADERRTVIEQAAASCTECRTLFDFFSVMAAEEFDDAEERETRADSNAHAMRAYVERIAAEDRDADEVLEEEKLLDSPTKAAWTNLQRKKRLLTGGIVRRLCAHANSICEEKPLDALTFADAAISVAEMLPDKTYPWSAVFELRGTAWKERANALLVLGKYPAALEALTHADRAYRELRSPGFGLSTVALVRASVLYEQGLLDEAAASAEKAEHGFAHLGQEERRMRALFLRASIRFEAGQIASAMTLFAQVLDYGESVNDTRWIARASYAMGNCEVDRRNLSEATLHFHRALVIFREIGPDRDRIATDHGLAKSCSTVATKAKRSRACAVSPMSTRAGR